MPGWAVKHGLHKRQSMLRAVKPEVVPTELGQHGVKGVDINVVFGGFVGLSVPVIIAARRNIYVVARRGFDEVGGPKRAVQVFGRSRALIELSERNCRPSHIADCTSLKERQARCDINPVAVRYTGEVSLTEAAIRCRVVLLGIQESVSNYRGAADIARFSADEIGEGEERIVVTKPVL